MADFPFKPQVVGWELTLRCNMRCLHCGSTAGQPRPDELTVEEGFSLIDQMVDLGTEIVTLSGGEPMTHPAWDQYAKRLIDKGVKTYMISNGLLLEQNIERLRACGMRRLGVSIDGDEPMHDYIRNHPGTFKAAMRGIAAAHEAGIKVGAVTHISGANKHLLEAMYNVMLQNKLDFWQIQIAFSQGRMKDHPQYALSPEDLPMIVNFVHKCQEEGKLPVVAGDNFGYYEVPAMRAKPWKGCFAGRHLMGVDADGSIKGCLSMPREFVEGNIRTESLRTIWEDPQRFRYTRYFSTDMLKGHCRNCPHGIPCRAGCTASAYSASGDRFDNPYCAFRVQSGIGDKGWPDSTEKAEQPAESAQPTCPVES